MEVNLPAINKLLTLNQVHEQWQPLLADALTFVDEDYLNTLLQQSDWLPGSDSLLAAFKRELTHCRYILFGESPYPRVESANGIAFFDASVNQLWGEKGLTKQVNKATSLRNIMKALLLAEGHLTLDNDNKISQSAIAKLDKTHLIQTLPQLFDNLQNSGFLLCNATPVLSPLRKPAHEAIYWQAFIQRLLINLSKTQKPLPTLILWGKIASWINSLEAAENYPKLTSEHPYNLSFIINPTMQTLFASLNLLQNTP